MRRSKTYFLVVVNDGLGLEFQAPDEYRSARKIEEEEIKYIGFKQSDLRLIKDMIKRGILIKDELRSWESYKLFVGRSMEVVAQYEELFPLTEIEMIAEIDPQLLPAISVYWNPFWAALHWFTERHYLYEQLLPVTSKREITKLRRIIHDHEVAAGVLNRRKFLDESKKLIRKVIKIRYLQPPI